MSSEMLFFLGLRLPKPTTEAAPGSAKGITDEGALSVRLRLSSQILYLHPSQRMTAARPVDTACAQRSSTIKGEAFTNDTTWEERTWKVLVRSEADVSCARIWGYVRFKGDGCRSVFCRVKWFQGFLPIARHSPSFEDRV